MCAVNRGVLGSQTGSMGGITASNWKGRNVYKQKVPSTNTSNSAAQAAQRRKFAALAKLAGLLGPAIRIGFNSSATKITEQNAFVKANFPAVTDNGTIATIDPTKLIFGQGIVGSAPITALVLSASQGNVEFTWPDNSNGTDSLPTDKAYLIVYDKLRGKAYVNGTDFTRSTAGGILDDPTLTGAQAANIEGYLFFKRATNTSTSPSTYRQAV